jgi:holo-[acyl-carrier protein] synthase
LIVGSGIDVVENSRVEREISAHSWTPEDGIFSSDEVHFCNHSKCPALLFATCFAVKEATLKALGIPAESLASFGEVQVLSLQSGRFEIHLEGNSKSVSRQLGVRRSSVAVTNNSRISGAFVVLES